MWATGLDLFNIHQKILFLQHSHKTFTVREKTKNVPALLPAVEETCLAPKKGKMMLLKLSPNCAKTCASTKLYSFANQWHVWKQVNIYKSLEQDMITS